MKRVVLFCLSLLLLCSATACSKQDESKIQELEAQITEKDASITKLEKDLKKQKEEFEAEKASLVSQEDYDAVKTELDTLSADHEKLQKDFDALSKEYADYKESMKVYEELSEAEAEQKKLEAEAEAKRLKEEAEAEEKAKKEEEERKKKEEEEAQAAEEAMGYETGITYDQLARTPDDYKGKKVKFTGEVVQVLEGDGEVDIRLAVDGDWDNIIYGYYSSSIVSSRVLEDDTITIYGVSQGLYTYESTMGGHITIPLVQVDKIDQ